MTPLEVAQRYAELFNAGRYREMGGLFAAESIWRRPSPAPEVRGGPAIEEGYSTPEHAANCRLLKVTDARYVVDGNTVAAVFVFSTDTTSSEVLDLFEVDDEGKITSMTAFPH